MKSADQKQVKKNIDDRCTAKIKQGSFGIACSIQDPGSHIINYIKDNTAEVQTKIGNRVTKHFFGCLHLQQDRLGKEHAACCQDQSQEKGNGKCCMHCVLYFFFVIGTKIL